MITYNGVPADQAAEWGRSSGKPERNREIWRLHTERGWPPNLLAWWFGISGRRTRQIIARQRELQRKGAGP